MSRAVPSGANLRLVYRVWQDAGGTVEPVRRTGEHRLVAPDGLTRSSVFNSRRKDAPREVTQFVNRVLGARDVRA